MCPVDGKEHSPVQEGEFDDNGDIVWYMRCSKCSARVG